MDVLEAIHSRRSVRRYSSESISDDELEKLVDAAASAPSAGNIQPWVFIIIRKPQNLVLLRSTARGMSGTPVAMIAICLDRQQTIMVSDEMALLSLGAALQNLLLTAHCLGLGACAIGSFHRLSTCSILALPQHLELKLLVALGHPVDKPESPRRRDFEEVRFFETVGVVS